MRVLFTTLQSQESEFTARVARHMERAGHTTGHAMVSRRAARSLRGAHARVWCFPDLTAAQAPADLDSEAARIEREYALPSLRDAYVHDDAYLAGEHGEGWHVDRAVRAFGAMEGIFDELRPDVVIHGVGRDIIRETAYLLALARRVPAVFALHSLFPHSLRLVTDDYMQRLVPEEEIRPLTDQERAEVEAFTASYTERRKPMLPHRRATVTRAKLADYAGMTLRRWTTDRDNEYVRPGRIATNLVRERARPPLFARFYRPVPEDRPFVYFPRQASTDFKMERQAPHCVDQEYLFERVADALPHTHELVVKEHPVSVGRNSLATVRRIARSRSNVRLVDPHTDSHRLMREAAAVVVINSNTGLESLFYGKPVLTLGQPVYSGYGLTVDVESFRELRWKVPEVLRFQPDRERVLQLVGAAMRRTRDGLPNWVDMSDENAGVLARSYLEHAQGELDARAQGPALA